MNGFDSRKMSFYYAALLGSVVLSIVSFSYNAWRMEVSESNSNRRTAAFEILKVLSEFEQIIYASHYDQDVSAGNPRYAWVKVGLVKDLSMLCGDQVEHNASELLAQWGEHWEMVPSSRESVTLLVGHVDALRLTLRDELEGLK